MDRHWGQVIYIKGHGEILVRFETPCGQRIKNPAFVTEQPTAVKCTGCLEFIQATITNASLTALIWGQVPRGLARQALLIKEG